MSTKTRSQSFKNFIGLAWCILFFLGCGGAGEELSSDQSDGPFLDIVGSVSTQTGRQSAMAGWVVVLMDKESSISRVAEVDDAGLFTLPHVFTQKVYTIALLSPDYVLTAMLALPSAQPQFIHQYFTLDATFLPKLIYKSETLTFQNLDGVVLDTKSFTTDRDQNLIPDEIRQPVDGEPAPVALGLALPVQRGGLRLVGQVNETDYDGDRIPNWKDSDMDNLGLPNIFDADDDNDTFADVFEKRDANGDQIPDELQSVSDQHFTQGLEWLGVIYEKEQQADDSYVSHLTIAAKVRDDAQPNSVQVRGPAKLLNDSFLADTQDAWDRLLVDDGKNQDGNAGDRIFGRRIRLAATTEPKGYQVLFVQLGYLQAEIPWFQEFGFTFPNNLTLRSLTTEYVAITFQFQILQDPFGVDVTANEAGDAASFIWYVDIYTLDGAYLFSTPEQESPTNSYTLGADKLAVLEDATTYTYQVVMQSRARVPGYPTYVIKSPRKEFTVSKQTTLYSQ